MRVESVTNHYRNTDNSVRVIEWTTYIDTRGKEYQRSRVYTIRLYSKDGQLEEYTNRTNIDVRA